MIVNAVNFFSNWSQSHITQEIIKIIPGVTNC